MEFTTANIFQLSPFGDVLNSQKYLPLSGEPWPDYSQEGWDAYDEGIQRLPTTHFVATVDDLTDMLDFDSEDIDGMDDDAGGEEEPLPTGHWTPTSSHDVYMVDTPKENNDEERKDAAKGGSLEQQSKRRRKRRSKPRLDKDNSHIDPALEQGEPSPDHATQRIKPNNPTLSKIIVRTTSHRTGTRSNRMPIKC